MADHNRRSDDSREQLDTRYQSNSSPSTQCPDWSELEYLTRGVGHSLGHVLRPNGGLSMEPYFAGQPPAMSPAYTESFSWTTYHGHNSEHRAQAPMLGMAPPLMPQYPTPRHVAPDPTHLPSLHHYDVDNAPPPSVNGAHLSRFGRMPSEHVRAVTQRSHARAMNEAGFSAPRYTNRTAPQAQTAQNVVQEGTSEPPPTPGVFPRGVAPQPLPGMSTTTTMSSTDPRRSLIMPRVGLQLQSTQRLESFSRPSRGQLVPGAPANAMLEQQPRCPFLLADPL